MLLLAPRALPGPTAARVVRYETGCLRADMCEVAFRVERTLGRAQRRWVITVVEGQRMWCGTCSGKSSMPMTTINLFTSRSHARLMVQSIMILDLHHHLICLYFSFPLRRIPASIDVFQ